jgi:carboxyl-terminal processing protease
MVTWSRLHAPSGYSIHRLGVPPTICTSGGIETVVRAIEGLRVRATEIENHMARWRAQVFADTDTIDRMRNTCPPEKVVRAVDLEIARALLDDVSAYRQAVGLTRSQIARQD